MKIYVTSDLHYHHSGIVRGTSTWQDKSKCRDFDTLEQHDNTIVNNINNTVSKDDILFVLGDWSFGGREQVAAFRERINCEIIHFVCGNHDHHIFRNVSLSSKSGHINAKQLFTTVQDLLMRDIREQYVVMCHYPIKSWHKERKGSIHLYGHTHEELGYHPRAICVSLDCHPEFRPFSFSEILKIIQERESKLQGTIDSTDFCIEC